jgi:hypothetical protein
VAVGAIYLARAFITAITFVPRDVDDVVLMLVLLAITYAGTRLFRGSQEVELRPAWKATGGPTSSFVVAGLWVVSLLNDLTILRLPAPTGDKVFSLIFLMLVDVILIFFYVNSGVRQRRNGNMTASASS